MKTKKYLFALLCVVMASLVWAEEQTVVFQQGVDGYEGCVDAELRNPDKGIPGNGPNEEILVISGF